MVFYIYFLLIVTSGLWYITVAQNEQNGDLRLISKGILPPYAGSLEMFYNGQWGMPPYECNGFRDDAVNVACYQLFGIRGFHEHDEYDSWWVALDVPVLFDKFECTGTENRLIDCLTSVVGDDIPSQSKTCFTPEAGAWLVCDTKEGFSFDKNEYMFIDVETNPQVTLNRFTYLPDNPVSSVDIRIQRVSQENSSPTTQRIDFTTTHSQNSATIDLPSITDGNDNPVVFEISIEDSTNPIAAFGKPTHAYIFRDLGEAARSGEYTIENAAYHVNESARDVEVTIVRSGPDGTINEPGSISVSTVDIGDATENKDYSPINSKLVMFKSGESTAQVSVDILRDPQSEENEMFEIQLDTPAVGLLGNQRTALITIVDDDRESFRFEARSFRVSESTGKITVKIVRNGPLQDDGYIDFSTNEGTAGTDGDFTAVSQTISFLAGVKEEFIDVKITGDNENEDDEYFYLQLSNPVGGTVNTDSLAAVIIRDDDVDFYWAQETHYTRESTPQLALTILRSGFIGEEATVNVRVQDGTALLGSDYQPLGNMQVIFPPNEYSAEILVFLINDEDYEESEEFSLLIESSNPSQIGSPARTYVVIEDDEERCVCQNNGICLEPDNVCWCPAGYVGVRCETSLCNPVCVNGGACSAAGICLCPPQHTGLQCEIVDAEQAGNIVVGQFSIIAIDGSPAVFTPTLNVAGSDEQREFDAKVLPPLQAAVRPLQGSVVINNRLPGSIRVEYTVITPAESSATVDDVDSNINNVFIPTALSYGVVVDGSAQLTFTQELCPSHYCSNGGTCSVDTVNKRSVCRCTSGYSGEQCQTSETSDLTPGGIAGIVVACIAIVIGILVILLLYFRKYIRQRQLPKSTHASGPTLQTLDLAPYPYTFQRGNELLQNPMVF